MRNCSGLASVVAVVVGLILAPGAWAEGQVDDTVKRLMALNPGVSAAEMREAIAHEADRSRVSVDQVAARALQKASAIANDHPAVAGGSMAAKGQRSSGSSSGGGGTPVKVGCSTRGNVIYSFASSVGVSHGHNAIYVGNDGCQIIQALGSGYTVQRYPRTSQVGTYPTNRARVLAPKSVTAGDRFHAESFVNSKIGVGYNSNFVFNRTAEAKSYNCSQLVWAAWMSFKHLDLDKDGGFGVYPSDIRDSPRVTFVKWL